MRSFYKSFTFTPAGTIPGTDTLLGFIRDQNHQTRTVAITLTAGLEGQKHKNKLIDLRKQLEEQQVPDLQGWKEKLLSTFRSSADPIPPTHVKTALDTPEHIPQTVEMILNETQQSHIILDCRSKEVFYSACRYLEIDDATMFSLAELEAFAPRHQKITQVKSVGEAHKLVTQLQRRLNLQDIADQIIKAQKFLLPDFDDDQDLNAANYERNLKKLDDMKERYEKTAPWKIKLVDAAQSILLRLGNKLGVSREDLDSHAAESLKKMRPDLVGDEDMSEQHQYFLNYMEFETELRKHFQAMYKKPLEEICFPPAISYMDFSQPGEPRRALRFRDGIYNLPYENCYFELVFKDVNGDAATLGILANRIDQDNTRFWPFVRPHNRNEFLIGLHYFLNFSDRQNPSWSVLDNASGKEIPQHHSLDYNMFSASIMSALNVITKMNEPGFEDKLVIPTGGKVLRNFNKHSPYFEYHVIDEYPEIYRAHAARQKGEKLSEEKRQGGVIRHMVKGHFKMTHTKDGMNVVYIADYARGDASIGFKTNIRDFRNS